MGIGCVSRPAEQLMASMVARAPMSAYHGRHGHEGTASTAAMLDLVVDVTALPPIERLTSYQGPLIDKSHTAWEEQGCITGAVVW